MTTNFFVCLSVLLSIIALLLVLALALAIPGFDLGRAVTSQDVLNLLGVSITGISFMIACYFVLKAVDAYSQLKEITGHLEEVRVDKEKLKREVDTLTQTRNEVFLTIGAAAESIFTNINETLYAAAESEVFSPEVKVEIMKLTEISVRSFGRLSFIKHLSNSDRINYLQKLARILHERRRQFLLNLL